MILRLKKTFVNVNYDFETKNESLIPICSALQFPQPNRKIMLIMIFILKRPLGAVSYDVEIKRPILIVNYDFEIKKAIFHC
jgi:hypothetical protein